MIHHLLKDPFTTFDKLFFAHKLCLCVNVLKNFLIIFVPDKKLIPRNSWIWQLYSHFSFHNHVELVTDVLIVEEHVPNLEFLLVESFFEVFSVTFFEYTREEGDRFINVFDAIPARVCD